METATTTDNDPAPFAGFVPPTANYSKMPHALIDALPLITSLSEMKVILYVLRHTWGYQDDEKRISLDEFRNGRKHTKRYLSRHPDAPPRIDSGTGMSINAIKSGIKRAVKHGFLSVDEDDSDKARIERWYSLSDSDYQELIPDRQELIPRGSEVDSRTLKETLIETTEREEPPLADSPSRGTVCAPPMGTLPGDDKLFSDDSTDTVPLSQDQYTDNAISDSPLDDSSETESLFKPPAPPSHEPSEQRMDRLRDKFNVTPRENVAIPIEIAAVVKKKRAETEHPDMTDASHDIHPWCDAPVSAWCALAEKSYAEMTIPTRIKLGGIFYKIGAATSATPSQVATAISGFKAEHPWWKYGFDWPGEGFCNRLGMMLVPDAAPEPGETLVSVQPAEPAWLGGPA